MLLDGNSGNLVATARSTRVKILLMDYIVSFRFLNKTLEEILNSNYKFIASNWEQLGVIVDSIPNSGFFKWAIPSLIRTGIRAIRIQTTDNKVWGDSAPFLIESKSPSAGTVHRAPPAPEGPFVTVRLEIIDIINNYRKSKGLNPLSFNNCLWLSAQKHAEWISNMGIDFFYDKDLNQKYNSHDEPSGTSWVEGCTEYHLTELDYPFVDPPVATLAQRTFDGWKKSEDHNTLMLLKERTKIGVGIAKGDYWYSITARLS